MLDDRDLSECGDCLCLASRRAARSITRAFDRKLRASGLRATQFTILVMLARAGPLSIGHLADALGAERTTLTRNLALIEAKRWVQISAGRRRALAGCQHHAERARRGRGGAAGVARGAGCRRSRDRPDRRERAARDVAAIYELANSGAGGKTARR